MSADGADDASGADGADACSVDGADDCISANVKRLLKRKHARQKHTSLGESEENISSSRNSSAHV